MKRLIWGAVPAAAVAGAWWLYREFGPPCDDLAREQEQAGGRQPGPSAFWSTDQRRDG